MHDAEMDGKTGSKFRAKTTKVFAVTRSEDEKHFLGLLTGIVPSEPDQDGVAVFRGAQFRHLRLARTESSNLQVTPPHPFGTKKK